MLLDEWKWKQKSRKRCDEMRNDTFEMVVNIFRKSLIFRINLCSMKVFNSIFFLPCRQLAKLVEFIKVENQPITKWRGRRAKKNVQWSAESETYSLCCVVERKPSVNNMLNILSFGHFKENHCTLTSNRNQLGKNLVKPNPNNKNQRLILVHYAHYRSETA